ncbi:hypothetical protein BGZ74_004697 [Mortierella antarctica]|nr:hypothetical protein BGZ74_004697 [Mortierella antarctica]
MDPIGVRSTKTWFQLHAQGLYDQAWLLGSTVVEQLLVNIIHTLQGPVKFIPFLMRDLLAVPCLLECVDRDLITALKTMVGSPTTLNIRNLLWHGFITPQETIPLDVYGSMLVVMTMTIASASEQHLQGSLQARHTSPRSYFFMYPLAESSADIGLPTDQFGVIYERIVVGSTWPSQPTSTPDHIESSFMFVMATLPLVEHSLRQMYVSLNECKEDRNFALVAGEYYLTLDVILEPYVPPEFFVGSSPRLIVHDLARIPNRLYEELGPGLTNLMKDIFMHAYGPRLRDRTSHGEFNTFIGRDIKQEPWLEFYVVLILGLLQHSMTAKNDICFGEHRNALDIAHTCIRNYTSTRFDEWTVARRETMRCFSLLASYRNLVFLSEASWIEIAPLIKGDSAFSLENLDSRLLPDQLSKALMHGPFA